VNILVIGDSYMPIRYFEPAFAPLELSHEVRYVQIRPDAAFIPATSSERGLREYEGDPAEIAELMTDVEILVVHGAPVTEAVLAGSDRLRLVCCARGGPVNVDVSAVTARGIPLVTTPGKNADAVADLTVAFIVMLARGLASAQRFVQQDGHIRDHFEGRHFLGHDLRDQTLGLVGFGQVGRRVAARVVPFGMHVLAYDPLVEIPPHAQLEPVATLEVLLERSRFVSLHARATPETANLLDADMIGRMQPGSYLVNTARETLVDEHALDAALATGHLAGVALDVFGDDQGLRRSQLLRHGNVVITPHLCGATHATLARGAAMILDEIERLAAGLELVNVANQVGGRP
jgi:D-3-phosphoglycerate dehydrogenase / 2-oxoglutarate reductase